MVFSSIRRIYFAVLRRLLLLWVRSETIDSSIFHSLRSDVLHVYVLQKPSISDLVVLDNECRKAGLNRPTARLNEATLEDVASFFYLRCEPDWAGRKSIQQLSPTLKKLVHAVESGRLDNMQIVPVSVY